MMDQPGLPYFDFLMAFLAQRNKAVETSFGRHVHWGYWPRPDGATCTDEDYGAAAERLTTELCDLAGIRGRERVLDTGCGFGGTIASMNERFAGMELVGLNIDPRQIERARQLVQPARRNLVSFCAGDACTLPFPDASFDRVLAVECIFHFPDREKFLREAFRVLRPGGVLALSDFVPMAAFVPVARFATESPRFLQFQYFGRCNLSYSIGRYRRLAVRTGFRTVAERNVTANTLPTYRYLQKLLGTEIVIEGITERIAGMIGILRYIAAFRLLNYFLLAYAKPA